MNWQKSLQNGGRLVKKHNNKRFRISKATLTIIQTIIQLRRRIRSLGVPVIRCNLTSRHEHFLKPPEPLMSKNGDIPID